jgi:hypothetical protein
MATTTQARPNRTTTNAASMPSGFDTEALLSQASLLTYAIQGLHNDAEGGSEIDGDHVQPIFELALEVERLARKLHRAAR